MEKKTTIRKLDETNYFAWAFEIEMLLRSKDLFEHCSISTEEKFQKEIMDDDKHGEVIKWISDDSKAIAIIGLNVSQKYFSTIKNCSSCKEVWISLKKHFAETSNSQILLLKCQFYESRMQNNESLSKYLERIIEIDDKLKNLGVETNEREVCFKVLSSVREEFNAITMMCMQLQLEKLTISFLRQQFAIEESRTTAKKTNSIQKSEPQVFFTQNNSSNQKKMKNHSKTTSDLQKCTKCGLNNHSVNECRAPKWRIDKFNKKKNKQTTEQNQSEKTKVFHLEVSKTSNVLQIKEKQKNEEDSDDSWFLDSGCTHHMTKNEKIFFLKSIKQISQSLDQLKRQKHQQQRKEKSNSIV